MVENSLQSCGMGESNGAKSLLTGGEWAVNGR